MTASPPELSTRILTERLVLRPYQPGDGGWYYRMSLRNHDHLTRFESNNAVNTIHSQKDAEIVIRDFVACWENQKAYFLGAFLPSSQEFVAQIYIGVVNLVLPEYEIGYFADVDHEGQGFVTEAVNGALEFIFTRLEAHRVRLECDETNLRSRKVAERCGFALEGLIRETKRAADGNYTGDLHYGLLRSEFTA